MDLKTYLSIERGRMSRLCREIDAHASDVSRWASGKRPIPLGFGPKIEKATEGQVTRREMFPENWHEVWPELNKPSAKTLL
ncbi:transcriptional regulator [Paraherbaspirillum soli]|uniref:Transcriptional regulator n=1 Tax=Paraherbaspirillum soli TaxID=631222 RepID=A0ABW0MD95_9BURK